MKMTIRTRQLLIAALALLLVMGSLVLGLPQSALADDTATINVKLSEGSGYPDETFTFHLYKVGHAEGSGVVAETGFQQSDIDVVNIGTGTKPDGFEQKCLDAALNLSKQLPSSGAAEITGAGLPLSLKPGEEKPVTIDKGLYLLIGDPVTVAETNKAWTPVPMLLGNIYGDSDFTILNNDAVIKISSEDVVHEYSVVKVWSPGTSSMDILNAVKPASVSVNIIHNGTVESTVKLDDSNNWSYSWSDNSNDAWDVAEVQDASISFFTTSYNSVNDGNRVSFSVTNTLTTKSIMLEKSLDGYDADMHSVTLAFKVSGKDAAGEEIYVNHVGMSFGPDDELTKSKLITGIPEAVQTIEVTEEYSSNYEQDGAPEITYDAATSTWTVKMNNKHDDHGPGGGVVNTYDYGKAPAQDFGAGN